MNRSLILSLILISVCSATLSAQSKTAEDLFKRFLKTEDPATAHAIEEANDSLYRFYCKAVLDQDNTMKVILFTSFLSRQPKIGLAQAYSKRGIAFTELLYPDSAVADFTNSIAIDSSDFNVFYYRGIGYRSLSQLDNAVRDFTKAITLKKNFNFAYHYRALTYYDMKDAGNALADVDKALQLDPQNVRSLILRGLIYELDGEYQKAIDDWRQAKTMKDADTAALDEMIRSAGRHIRAKK